MYIATIIVSLVLFYQVNAQLGPEILSPAQNDTVPAGQNVDIVYRYQNMGTGNYTIDVALWGDAGVTTLIQNITTDHPVEGGNSTGVHLDFLMNDTYTMKVPHGLNSTFWLTVTENAVTTGFPKGLRLRSRPVMLHTSGSQHLYPTTPILIALISMLSLGFIFA
jgi:hypothetical protein